MADIQISLDDIKDFGGKSIVITGGSSGIGLSIAQIAKSKGARVLIADLRPPTDSAASDLLFQKTDVTKWTDLVALMKRAKEEFGAIDMVCANAGICEIPENSFSDILDSSGELVEPKYKTIQVNLIGVFNTVKLAIHYMREQPNGGSITLTGSIAGYSSVGIPIYTASKHGMIGMMRGLRTPLVPLKIRLNYVAPGITESALLPQGSKEKLSSVAVESQSSEYPALATLYFHQTSSMHGRTIYSVNRTFRELEGGYEAASQIMYGDNAAGREYVSDPNRVSVVKQTLQTIV